MNSELWRRVAPILDHALTLEHDEVGTWLDSACGDDAELRRVVDSLLRAGARDGGILDTTGFHDSFSSQLLPGTLLADRYRIVGLVGLGGMGEVYRADDLKLGQAVALKFIPAHLQQYPEFLDRLSAEVRLARKVSHPNVCRVYDIGEASSRPFLSMEYVDGEDLASLMSRIGRLPPSTALDIARQICAGVEAAHRQGVVHRDLKPANVILDGKGHVRITDFGLAVTLEGNEKLGPRAGTPAYMAPEQFAGQDATTRTDIYALGIVLYELFTGMRPFQARTFTTLEALKQQSAPMLSTVVEGFDSTIENTILACLEQDPALRPPSAAAIATALPGGDAISAALAAGLTPSPDLVEASGPEGGLSVREAGAAVMATLSLIVMLIAIADRASVLGWLPFNRHPHELEANARGILSRLGYVSNPVDSTAQVVLFDRAFEEYVRSHDASADRWNSYRSVGQFRMTFFYRQSGRFLRPLGTDGQVSGIDPAPAPEDVMMLTDLRGKLIWLEARLSDAAAAGPPTPPVDWSRLTTEAGLNISTLSEVAPTRQPLVTSDTRVAWSGTLPDFNNYPVRVEAAALSGVPVFFELVVPWDSYWEPASPRAPVPIGAPLSFGIYIAFATICISILALRNWRNGHGDRRGALRLAAVIFVLRLGVWIFGGHHVAQFRDELLLFMTALGKSLADAAVTWGFYIAFEPSARRLFPRALISWTRLLRGRVLDPLVGRDILFGIAFGMVLHLLWRHLYVVIPHALGLQAPPPPSPHNPGRMPYLFFLDPPQPQTLFGGRFLVEAFLGQAIVGFVSTVLLSIILLGLRLLLRNPAATLGGMMLIISMASWPAYFSQMSAIGMACSAAGALVVLWLFHLGLLSLTVAMFAMNLWSVVPITSNPGSPHFAAGVMGILPIVALALYGATIAARVRLAPFRA